MGNSRKYEMAKHAFNTVPYYREKLEQNPKLLRDIEQNRGWENLPLTEKNEIVLAQDQLISEEYLGEMVTGRLLRSHTSGSTGTYLDVYWNRADYTTSLIPLWKERYKYARVHTRDRVCMFNTTLKNQKEYLIAGSQMLISKKNITRKKLVMLYEKILEFDPVWILIHPGIAGMLLQIVKEERLQIPASLRYIELTGEMVLEGLTRDLEIVFECKVRCHYGTMEVNTIGIEEEGGYRIFDNSTYVEILDSDGNIVKEGQYGNIYVTSLHNRAMPLIRYGIGDMGRIVSGNNGEQRIELKKARRNDLLDISAGYRMPPDVLLGPVEEINQMMGSMVYQFQVVQKSNHFLVIKVVLDSEMSEEEFIRLYQKYFNEDWRDEFDWKYEFYRTILVNPDTGKSGWFENQIERNKSSVKRK